MQISSMPYWMMVNPNMRYQKPHAMTQFGKNDEEIIPVKQKQSQTKKPLTQGAIKPEDAEIAFTEGHNGSSIR